MTAGFIAKARAIATRCRWPPERCEGGVGLVAEPDLFEQGSGDVLRLGSRQAFDDRRPRHDVAERRHVREQIEMLEDHAGSRAEGGQLAVDGSATMPLTKAHLALAHPDATPIRLLEQVHAAQEGRFSGAARSDDRDDRTAFDTQRHAFQHTDGAEGLPQLSDLDHGA
jgi:hypothetical protein